MRNIRHNIFETNSSSSHSITISYNKDTLCEKDKHFIPISDKGKIILNGGEFGWETIQYNDSETKANYCAIASVLYSHDTSRQEMLKKVLCEYTGAKKVIFDFSVDDYESEKFSHIDHQSYHVANDAFHDEESLKHFIFNDCSWLCTGNDNDDFDDY